MHAWCMNGLMHANSTCVNICMLFIVSMISQKIHAWKWTSDSPLQPPLLIHLFHQTPAKVYMHAMCACVSHFGKNMHACMHVEICQVFFPRLLLFLHHGGEILQNHRRLLVLHKRYMAIYYIVYNPCWKVACMQDCHTWAIRSSASSGTCIPCKMGISHVYIWCMHEFSDHEPERNVELPSIGLGRPGAHMHAWKSSGKHTCIWEDWEAPLHWKAQWPARTNA